MNGFELHPEAYNDIDEIAIYIGEDSQDAAYRVVDDLYAAFAKLARFPQQGHCRPDLTLGPLRFK